MTTPRSSPGTEHTARDQWDLQSYLDGKAIRNDGRVHLDISFNELKKLRAALRTWAHPDDAQSPSWQPIETAPLDRFILVYCHEDDSHWLAKWRGGEWYGSDCEHGITRTGHSYGDPDYVTGWFVSQWRDVPRYSVVSSTDSGRLTFCETCNANRVHRRASIVDGVQIFECPKCTVVPSKMQGGNNG